MRFTCALIAFPSPPSRRKPTALVKKGKQMTAMSSARHLQVISIRLSCRREEGGRMRLLVVEDEARIRSFLARALEVEGFQVDEAADGERGLAAALAHDYGLVILDLMLPGRDGLDVLEELHARRPDLPVLILSARSELPTKLRGFELGAADFMAKPFSLDELFARIRVRTRARHGPEGEATLRLGRLTLDISRRQARVGDRVTNLSDREFRLLHFLML